MDIGETLHLNVLAGVIVLLLPLWGSFALCQRNNELPGPRWIYLISLLYLTAIVIIAQSRGAYLAIVISFLVLFLLHWPNRFLIWGLLVSVCTGIYWWHFPYQILNFISADDSLQGWHERVEIWQQSINALYIFTFTGIGIGTFIDVIPLFFPLRANIANYPHAHNLLLQIALDLGIPGFIAYLSLLFNLIVMLSVTLRKADRRTLVYTLGLGLAGSLTAMLVHGLLDAVLWGTKLSFLPWILFALISQLFYQVQQIEQ